MVSFCNGLTLLFRSNSSPGEGLKYRSPFLLLSEKKNYLTMMTVFLRTRTRCSMLLLF